MTGDPIRSRAWRKLRDRVVIEEPYCRLRLAGCTITSETADHVIPRSVRPDLALVRSNLQDSCLSCNMRRGVKALGPEQVPRALAFFDT